MVIRSEAWPEGTPCWVELGVDDIDKAVAFYRALFGWEVERDGTAAGGYVNCTVGGRKVAGIGSKLDDDRPAVWTTYLAAGDVDEVAGKITAAGGRVLAGPFDVMDLGRMTVALDPTGAAFGVWRARAHIGVELANEPSALVWNEQLSGDLDAAKRFYRAVFGYTYDDIENGSYAMLKVAGRVAGGLGALDSDAPPSTPPHWRTYFEVPVTDAACVKVAELGGQVVAPPTDTPYGRLARVTDDQGAHFYVIQGN